MTNKQIQLLSESDYMKHITNLAIYGESYILVEESIESDRIITRVVTAEEIYESERRQRSSDG